MEVSALGEGALTYAPDANGAGAPYTTFAFRVFDGDDPSTDTYTMTIDVTAVNDAPTLVNALDDQLATVGAQFTYEVPDDAFADVDGETPAYSATLDDDTALPAWLAFDPATKTFSGTPDDVGTLAVKVTVTDAEGDRLVLTFDEALDTDDGARPPPADAFTVRIAGRAVAVASVAAGNPQEIVLHLPAQATVLENETVTVSYATPASDPLRDDLGNETEAFAGVAVDNASEVEDVAPKRPATCGCARSRAMRRRSM